MEKSNQADRTKILVLNGIIAAIYVVVSFLISPIAQGPFQFRISECLNHSVVYDKRLRWGVLGGVFLYNLMFSSFGILDVVFGTAQTFLALTATAMLDPKKVSTNWRLFWNTVFFTVSMALIAWMLHITIKVPFWITYATTAFGEAVVMGISAFIYAFIASNREN